jgi:hypothetical protein
MALSTIAFTAGTANASAVQPRTTSPAPVYVPAWVSCGIITQGPNGFAACKGNERWRLALYCDFPSPSPVYGSYVNGQGTSAASCWFQANAQYGAIEVG